MFMEKFNLTGDSFDLSSAFILGRKAYDIGVRVVKWNEKNGYDGYKRPLRIKERHKGVDNIKQLLIHHAGQDRRDPGTMYRVLWAQRKLSVHFALDEFAECRNGLEAGPIVWQFVDCDWVTKHAGSMNKTSIGIEVCHFPSAWENTYYYSPENNRRKNNLPHEVITQPVFSKKRKVFAFTDGATDALARLYAGCWVAVGHQRNGGFVNEYDKAPKFPRTNGKIPFDVVSNFRNWTGLILHRQCSKRKWDPAGLDLEFFEKLVEDYYNSFRLSLSL
jgi:hypothetical protein